MTGRDLIIIILDNHLEDAEMSTYASKFMKDEKVASIFGVGMATVKAWYENNYFEVAFQENGVIYVHKNEIIRILSEKLKKAGVKI